MRRRYPPRVRIALEPTTDPADYPFAHAVRARFAETDAMGVVHHGSYLPWLEEARVAYLRHLGHPYTEVRAAGHDLAVIEVYVRYVSAVRFDDEVAVHLRLGAPSGSTFQIAYLLRRGAERVAAAVTVHAYLDAVSGRPVRLPDWLRQSTATPGA